VEHTPNYPPLENNEPRPPMVDTFVAERLTAFSQRTGRRGFLARVGKIALGALGFTIATELLPSDRRTPVGAGHTCSDPRYCGLWGRFCTCCNGRQDVNFCPANTTWFNFWAYCCHHPNQSTCHVTYYWDCCGSFACNCNFCTNNQRQQQIWGCDQHGLIYTCTAVVMDYNSSCRACPGPI
jgi:hypothetical protein